MISLTIDNQTIEVAEGTTVLEAAEKLNIYIPTLCHHESLIPYGGCRLCVVEVSRNGTADLTSSCTYKVEEGLKVKTNTERVRKVRRLVLELLLAEGTVFHRFCHLLKIIDVPLLTPARSDIFQYLSHPANTHSAGNTFPA